MSHPKLKSPNKTEMNSLHMKYIIMLHTNILNNNLKVFCLSVFKHSLDTGTNQVMQHLQVCA
jgi:hypothetical protein